MMYAIQHIASGHFMRLKEFGRGYTWWEPGLESDDISKPLRLFISVKAAKTAIIAWAKGHAVQKKEGNVFDFSSEMNGDDYAEWLEYEPVKGRSRSALQIVPFELVAKEPIKVYDKHNIVQFTRT